jgi:membrane associated rhomboid family serine protease
LKKLYDGVQRFCAAHPRFGIPNLMRVIVIGNVAVYVLMLLTQANDANALSFLTFNLNALLHGEVWRLVTFVFVPAYSSPFALLISLYFYYWIGSTLERQWGTAKFNLYYISGALLTVLGVVLASLITGNPYLTAAGTGYVNLSMFFAFAFLFPDTTVLLFFILPVRMKWLAYLDGALFAFDIIKAIGAHNWAGVVLPIVALLNFAVFIWPEVHYLKERAKYQNSRKTVQFRQAQQQQAKQAQQQGYRHKCAVCGRTDSDYPNLQFRYCSKCAGYRCFCQDHIFSHVHFTEEDQNTDGPPSGRLFFLHIS